MMMHKVRGIFVSVIGFVLLFVLSGPPPLVFAAEHSLEELDIHVFVNDDGSAVITERRVANLSEGTENYIVIENLGKSRITDFTVTENGVLYSFVNNWNINDSRQNKTNRNGIIETANGYELAWGIGEYGRHEYILQYTITDFVKQLNDAQMIFWRFVNDETNIPPKNVRIEIESNKTFSADEEGIWAFGHSGDIHFTGGNVVLTTDRAMTRSEYVTILVRLADGTFQTNDHVNDTFEAVQKQAFKDSDYKLKGDFSIWGFFAVIVGVLATLTVPIIVVGLAIFLIIWSIKKNKYMSVKKFNRQYKEEYYRDYPYDGNFLHAYYILFTMGVSTFERVLTALFLKWIYEDRLTMQTEMTGLVFKKETAALLIQDDGNDLTGLEKEMYEYMKLAAGNDGILQQKEFNRWGAKNHSKIYKWEEKLKANSAEVLKNEGYVSLEKRKIIFFVREVYEMTEKGHEMEMNTHKFVNYLHDFSLLNEHDAINVKLWDELMIWAALLGRTKVVSEQFEKLYPNYVTESAYDPHAIIYTQAMTSSFHSSIQQSRSSGGGGSSSSGGGGGSFGGGSGGGTR